MQTNSLSIKTIVQAVQDQVFSKLDDEIVILALKDGIYYGLNPVGARIWEFIQEPRRIEELRDALLKEYDVPPEQCERESIALICDLQKHGLIEVKEPVASMSKIRP